MDFIEMQFQGGPVKIAYAVLVQEVRTTD